MMNKTLLSVIFIVSISVTLTSLSLNSFFYDSQVHQENVVYAVTEHIDQPKKPLTLVELFEKVESGVVSISTQKPTVDSIAFFGGAAVGSGFVYDNQGHIITNNHVIKNAGKITVTFTDGFSYDAEVIGADDSSDLAIIKVDREKSKLNPLPLGDSSITLVGQQVAAIGNPFGLSGSMTAGIVSQIGRLLPSEDSGFSIPDVIQTDAAINPGNSGGPLLNMYGEVVGINTAIFSSIGEFTGVGFAVPSNTATKIIPSLIKNGEYSHPWIGISGRDIDPDLAKVLGLDEAKGVMIVTVVTDSPADKADLRGSSQSKTMDDIEHIIGGDIIVSIDGNEVRKIDDILIHLQREKSVGDETELGIIRDNTESTITVILGDRPPSS
jgi:S1-C subfamily serine protease